MSRIGLEVYSKDAITVAPYLIGKLLCRNTENGIKRLMITETECYYGSEDTACHAKRGITPGNKTIFMAGGVSYVYLCYGIHYLFNVVTGPEGHGEGVLIRGVEGAKGPGVVTKLMGIDKSFNAHDLCSSTQLWLEDHNIECEYASLKRVGIDYAEESDRNRLWRYVLTEIK